MFNNFILVSFFHHILQMFIHNGQYFEINVIIFMHFDKNITH